MFGIVLFDSINFNLPFYYVIFYFLGRFFGKIFNLSHRISRDTTTGSLNLITNQLSLILLLGLLLLRFYLGKIILEKIHIAYISDALYLFFIGTYYSKWKVLVNQIDSFYYKNLK